MESQHRPARRRPRRRAKPVSLWDKIDVDEYKRHKAAAYITATSDAGPQAQPTRWGKARNRLYWATLNTLGAVFWIYVLLKVLVDSVDRWMISKVSPSLIWVVDYRGLILFSFVTLVLLITRRLRGAFFFLYILFYPLVVLLWKIPRLYYRAQSWNLLIRTFQVLWSLGKSIRFTCASMTVFALATVAIVRDGSTPILWASIIGLLTLWALLVGRAALYAIVPSKFMVYQQKLLTRLLDSEHIWSMASLPPGVKNHQLARLERNQIDTMVTQATYGLWLYGGSALWAEKLDSYRKSGASVVFNAASVVALMGQAVVIFALVNLGLFRIDASEYSYTDEPGLATFIRYSLSSMFTGEIQAVQPSGSFANVVSVLAGFSCAVIVLVFIVSVIFSMKQGRDDRVAEESIQAMRRKADAFAGKLMGEYSLPLADLMVRLFELGGLVGFWARRIDLFARVVSGRTGDGSQEHGHSSPTASIPPNVS